MGNILHCEWRVVNFQSFPYKEEHFLGHIFRVAYPSSDYNRVTYPGSGYNTSTILEQELRELQNSSFLFAVMGLG